MSSYQTKKTPGDTAWFSHDRFGMFIHFGLYALPARHEWVKSREEIADALRGTAPIVEMIGDCVEPGIVRGATFRGYHAALDL